MCPIDSVVVQIHKRARRIDASHLAAGPVAEIGGRTTQSVVGHTCCCCDHGGLMSLPDVRAAPALTWGDQHLLCSAEDGAPCRLQQ